MNERRLRVLVADDSESIRRLFEAAGSKLNVDVTCVQDKDEALRMLKQTPHWYNAVIIDYRSKLGEVNGTQFHAAAKFLLREFSIRLTIFTGGADGKDLATLLQKGVLVLSKAEFTPHTALEMTIVGL